MTVTYKNRRGKTYYLHEGKTKTGKPKCHFSLKNNGELVDEIPDGYEIYEHPGTGGVFLRKKLPQLILNIEKDVIEKELKKKEGSVNTYQKVIFQLKEEDSHIFAFGVLFALSLMSFIYAAP